MKRTPLRVLCLLTLLLACGLRLWRLDFQELRGDEVFGYFFSLRPWAEIVQATIDLKEPHPIASYLLQQWWLSAAGHSEFALRYISSWFGLLAVALLGRSGRALDFSGGATWLAMLLLACSPYALWHSQDARMYSMSLALTTASTWLMLMWLQRQRPIWALAYLLSSWAALHTHYFTIFVLAAQNLFIVSRTLQHPRLRFTLVNWLGLQVTIAFFYTPWLLQVLTTLTDYHGNGDSPTLGAMVQRAASVLLVGESVPAAQRIWWALLASCLLAWGMVTLVRTGANGRRALWLLSFYLFVPLVVTWWSARQRPIFNERYLIAALPPFLLLLAAGFDQLANGVATTMSPLPHKRIGLALTGRYAEKHRWQRLLPFCSLVLLLVAATGMLLALNRYYYDPVYSKTRGWRDLAVALQQLSADLPAATVRIAQNFPDPTLWYYYTGPLAHVVLPPAADDEAGAQAVVQELQQAGVIRVLLPLQPAPNLDARALAPAALATAYTRLGERPVSVWPVQIYAAPPAVVTPTIIHFTNGVSLTGFATQPDSVTPGNLLAVYLQWRGPAATLTGSEKVFVQLLNGAGALVAEDDRPLTLPANRAAMTTPASYGILLPTVLSPGNYALIVGLYDPAQPGAPRVLTMTATDHVVLQTLVVKN